MKIAGDIKKRFALLLQGSAVVFLARLAGAGIGLLIQLLLARSIGGEQLGIVFIALAIANIGSVVAALGYPSVSVRFLRRYKVRGAQEKAEQFRKQSIKDVVLFAFVLIVVLVSVISLFSLSEQKISALYLGVLMIPLFAFLALNGGFANAHERIDISYLPDIFIRPFFWLLLLVISLGLGLSLEAGDVVLTAFIATLIALLVQWFWMNSSIEKADEWPSGQSILIKPGLRKLWRLAALPMIAMTLLTNMIFDIDVMVLSLLLSSTDIALFGIAFKIAFLIGFGVHVIQQASYPKITDAYSLKNLSLMRSEILNAIVPAILGSLLSIFIIIIAGHWILSFFGSEFETAYVALLLLTLCALIRAVGGPASQILVLAGKQKQMIIVYGSGLFLLAGLNLILVPPFGVDGAALALVGATLYWSTCLSIVAFKATNVRVDGFSLELLTFETLRSLPFFKKNGVRF